MVPHRLAGDVHAPGLTIREEAFASPFRKSNRQSPTLNYQPQRMKSGPSSLLGMTVTMTTVIDYIVQRLADEGITDCRSAYRRLRVPVCDAVVRTQTSDGSGAQ